MTEGQTIQHEHLETYSVQADGQETCLAAHQCILAHEGVVLAVIQRIHKIVYCARPSVCLDINNEIMKLGAQPGERPTILTKTHPVTQRVAIQEQQRREFNEAERA